MLATYFIASNYTNWTYESKQTTKKPIPGPQQIVSSPIFPMSPIQTQASAEQRSPRKINTY